MLWGLRLNRLTILGSGASEGVPCLGCACRACRSGVSRLRSSALIEWKGHHVLIDAGPDVRTQLLRAEVNRLDAVLLTHDHFDHIGGLEELRPFSRKVPLPVYLSDFTLTLMKHRLHYLFKQHSSEVRKGSRTVGLEWIPVDNLSSSQEFDIGDLRVHYCSYRQGHSKVFGFRFGALAYMTDLRHDLENVVPFLRGVETLILSAVSPYPTRMNLGLDEAVCLAKEVEAKNVYFTHISHEICAESSPLPSHMRFAYDGLRIPFSQ